MRDHTRVKGMQRAELAQHTGCNLETVRYYEKVGLLPEPPRTPGGYRNYDATHERRIRFILRARELGFSLQSVSYCTSLTSATSPVPLHAQWRQLTSMTSGRRLPT
jgi:DNA-binding transcriptional MerR regulator